MITTACKQVVISKRFRFGYGAVVYSTVCSNDSQVACMLLFMVPFVDSMNTMNAGNNLHLKIDDFCHFNCILKDLSDLKMYASALCFFI